MRRNAWILIGLFGAAVSVSGTTVAHADKLTFALFGGLTGDAQTKTVIAPFAQANNLDYVTDNRDWGIGVLASKIESGSATWDIVAAEDIETMRGCDEGLFEPVDWSKISAADQLVPIAKIKCGLANNLYMLGLAYDADRIKDGPKNWQDFWDTKKWPGKRSMYKSPRDTLEIALMADGVPLDKVYEVLATPAGVDRAFHKLDEIKSDLLWWDNAGNSRQMLASGETVMTATYMAGVRNMNLKEKTNFAAVFNGAVTHSDYWAIVKGTPNLTAAHKFLDYFSRPDVEAALSNASATSGPNPSSVALVSKEIAPILAINPDLRRNALDSSPQFWLDHFEALSQRFNAWLGQ